MARFTRMAAHPSRLGDFLLLSGGKYADKSIKNVTITNDGTTLGNGHNGRVNRAFVFDGNDRAIDTSITSNVDFAKGFTAMVILNAANSGETGGRIFDKTADDTGSAGVLLFTRSTNRISSRVLGGDIVSESGTISYGAYERIFVNCSVGRSCSIYKNLVLSVTAAGGNIASITTNAQLRIGNRAFDKARDLNGTISTFLLTRVLSFVEILKTDNFYRTH